MSLHIAFAAPIATEHVAALLQGDVSHLPKGYGGAPFTAVIITELLRQGHKVSAFTTDPSIYGTADVVKASGEGFDFYVCAERPRAWRLNGSRIGRAMDGFAYEINILAREMAAVKPDIIHAHWSYEFAMAAIKCGLPHLITCHDAPWVVLRFNPFPFRAIRYLMARSVFWRGKHFSTVSAYMQQQLQHYTKQTFHIVPNPLADYVLVGGQARQLPQTRRIVMVANGWDARKNPQTGLKAFADYRQQVTTAELHLFGHGFGSGEAAQQWCQQQGITAGMHFHGATAHRQLIAQLQSMDVLLHPALEESFGVVIAEAMALGLPVVAGRQSGAVPWVVGHAEHADCCAVLTDVADSQAVAQALRQIFDQDYGLRSAVGLARARTVFAADKITTAYGMLYQQVLTRVRK